MTFRTNPYTLSYNTFSKHRPRILFLITTICYFLCLDGWLQKEGFISDKYVEASNKDKKVTFVKCFRSFVDMLHVIKRSQINHVLTKSELESIKKDGKGGLYVVVNFLLDPINLHNLITWLEKAVKEKIDDIPGNLMHCKARMIIEYGCCTTSPIKWLKPEYSEFRNSVG